MGQYIQDAAILASFMSPSFVFGWWQRVPALYERRPYQGWEAMRKRGQPCVDRDEVNSLFFYKVVAIEYQRLRASFNWLAPLPSYKQFCQAMQIPTAPKDVQLQPIPPAVFRSGRRDYPGAGTFSAPSGCTFLVFEGVHPTYVALAASLAHIVAGMKALRLGSISRAALGSYLQHRFQDHPGQLQAPVPVQASNKSHVQAMAVAWLQQQQQEEQAAQQEQEQAQQQPQEHPQQQQQQQQQQQPQVQPPHQQHQQQQQRQQQPQVQPPHQQHQQQQQQPQLQAPLNQEQHNQQQLLAQLQQQQHWHLLLQQQQQQQQQVAAPSNYHLTASAAAAAAVHGIPAQPRVVTGGVQAATRVAVAADRQGQLGRPGQLSSTAVPRSGGALRSQGSSLLLQALLQQGLQPQGRASAAAVRTQGHQLGSLPAPPGTGGSTDPVGSPGSSMLAAAPPGATSLQLPSAQRQGAGAGLKYNTSSQQGVPGWPTPAAAAAAAAAAAMAARGLQASLPVSQVDSLSRSPGPLGNSSAAGAHLRQLGSSMTGATPTDQGMPWAMGSRQQGGPVAAAATAAAALGSPTAGAGGGSRRPLAEVLAIVQAHNSGGCVGVSPSLAAFVKEAGGPAAAVAALMQGSGDGAGYQQRGMVAAAAAAAAAAQGRTLGAPRLGAAAAAGAGEEVMDAAGAHPAADLGAAASVSLGAPPFWAGAAVSPMVAPNWVHSTSSGAACMQGPIPSVAPFPAAPVGEGLLTRMMQGAAADDQQPQGRPRSSSNSGRGGLQSVLPGGSGSREAAAATGTQDTGALPAQSSKGAAAAGSSVGSGLPPFQSSAHVGSSAAGTVHTGGAGPGGSAAAAAGRGWQAAQPPASSPAGSHSARAVFTGPGALSQWHPQEAGSHNSSAGGGSPSTMAEVWCILQAHTTGGCVAAGQGLAAAVLAAADTSSDRMGGPAYAAANRPATCHVPSSPGMRTMGDVSTTAAIAPVTAAAVAEVGATDLAPAVGGGAAAGEPVGEPPDGAGAAVIPVCGPSTGCVTSSSTAGMADLAARHAALLAALVVDGRPPAELQAAVGGNQQ